MRRTSGRRPSHHGHHHAIPQKTGHRHMDRTEHISIEQTSGLPADELDRCDFSFDIAWELNAPYQDLLDLRALPTRRKHYGFDPAGWADEASGKTALFRATAGGRLAGFVAIGQSWNGMAEIAELAVDRHCRRQGIGQLLLAAAESWARGHGFGFMRLETQSNNVAACSTYARGGFVLGGHDRLLYADDENDGEVALFWYKDLRDGQTARIRTVDPESMRPVG
ncbi:GCN5-related N-acetyltransferase [Burkholderia lata]|uniref:GCN5-related N-acetyltransferase n=2 Tax=Burkholderia lata (strain ATCC 17760 / DSM 23089 / LMG 22485 / NCIMB 9086 / R18194 / 383) TaxID=482957 RepID=Q391F1_BURL3|nr:GCN5-related N-acetyltransferase [Burkholderia lata]